MFNEYQYYALINIKCLDLNAFNIEIIYKNLD